MPSSSLQPLARRPLRRPQPPARARTGRRSGPTPPSASRPRARPAASRRRRSRTTVRRRMPAIAGIGVGHELLEHLERVDRLVRQRRVERCAQRLDVDRRAAPAARRATRGTRPRARRSCRADRAIRSSPPTLQASASLAACASSTSSSSAPARWAAASRRSSRPPGGRVSLYDPLPGRDRARARRRCARASTKLAEKGGADPDEVLARVSAGRRARRRRPDGRGGRRGRGRQAGRLPPRRRGAAAGGDPRLEHVVDPDHLARRRRRSGPTA